MSNRLSGLLCLAILTGTAAAVWAQNGNVESSSMAPVYLTANDLSIATGQPSLVVMSGGGAQVPVWSLSGGTVGQSVVGVIPGFSADCGGVKIEIVVTTVDPATSPAFDDVYRVHLSQMDPNRSGAIHPIACSPVRTPLPPKTFQNRTIVLESYYNLEPGLPLTVRIQREPDDPADTYTRPTGLIMVKATPLPKLPEPHVVQDVPGYNSWPMIQAIGKKLVCTYSRGTAHSIGEDARLVYARTSTDNGKTWTPETIVAQTPGWGEVTIGKGNDSTGAALLWVRRCGKGIEHDVYRSEDGEKWVLLSTPKLDPVPIQITDIIAVPNVGFMALWFAGNYGDEGPCHSWGTFVSSDEGKTWTQNVIESELTKAQWPTEQSAAYLGDGKIIAIARTESGASTTDRAQFQMVSTDYGKTWTRTRTNITNVLASTPSLIYDSQTGLLSAYYYQRGRGVAYRRVVKAESIFDCPLCWPESEPVALGSDISFDAGNANAVDIDGVHFLAFYSGKHPDTSVLVSEIPAPKKADE